jgi:NAD(P)H-binding
MRILIAGATGALGRHLVPRLIAAGHRVIGTTRRSAKVDTIRQLGGEPTVVDGLDGAKVREVVRSVQPDVIVHEMTDLGGAVNLRHFDQVFASSNRLRTAGLDHLLAAARETAVKRIVVQSYSGWPYAREGSAIKSEGDALDPHPPREFRRSLDAIRYLEDLVTRGSDLEGVVLRYGVLRHRYGSLRWLVRRPNRQATCPSDRQRRGLVVVRPHRGCGGRNGPRCGALTAGSHLQHRRRRSGASARLAPLPGGTRRGQAASAYAGLAWAHCRRSASRSDDDGGSSWLQCKGQT